MNQNELSWWDLQRNGFKVIIIGLMISFVLSTIAILVAVDSGMVFSPIMIHEDCIAVYMGSIQFLCP